MKQRWHHSLHMTQQKVSYIYQEWLNVVMINEHFFHFEKITTMMHHVE